MKKDVLPVVDHAQPGFVRLVSYMQPAHTSNAYQKWTGDLEVVRNARASYNADWRTGENEKNDEKLIRYLLKNRHTSPFEAMVFTFEVKAPLFVFRQWHRHRTWSYNEISARYAELDEGFYLPEVSKLTMQSEDNKQMRTTEQHPEAADLCELMRASNLAAFTTYKALLARKAPRELARSVLPVAAYSRMFATVDLHNLMHFLVLRLHKHAQYEIRVYAEALLELIEPLVPFSVKVFREIHEQLFAELYEEKEQTRTKVDTIEWRVAFDLPLFARREEISVYAEGQIADDLRDVTNERMQHAVNTPAEVYRDVLTAKVIGFIPATLLAPQAIKATYSPTERRMTLTYME